MLEVEVEVGVSVLVGGDGSGRVKGRLKIAQQQETQQ